MYLEETISRINNIEWDEVGTKALVECAALGVKFLQRLANFYDKTSNEPYPPLFSDVATVLGDTRKMDFEQYYNDKTKEFLGKTIYQYKIFEYYLRLSRLADENFEAQQYLNIYEPLIEILERGGSFKLRKNDLEIEGITSIPLNNWFHRYRNVV